MDISVIIVSYNCKEVLDDCLKSLVIATKNLEAEVVVVDNHSTDGTPQLAEEKFPQVRLIANKKNLGFSKANNQAIKKARGRYVLILNPDTKVMPDTVIKMIGFMDKNEDITVSTCRVELPTGLLDRDCRRLFPTPWRAFCHFSGLSKIFAGSGIFDQYYMGYLGEDRQHEIDACAGAFMMVRASVIRKVGHFDEDFFFYGEDLDWCYRFKKAGYKIIFTPITKIIHLRGVSSGIKKESENLTKATLESKKKALRESTEAMILFYQKHYTEKYPFIVTWLVFLAVKTLEFFRLMRLKK